MDNISSGKGRKAGDMTHNFPKGQIKGSLSGWQSLLASRAWCRTVSGRECPGYFYKQLQRYQQCGAGAEIPIFADEISWTRVPANESACQQAQEGRRKQRPTVIKKVTVLDLEKHRDEGRRLWLSQPSVGQQRRAWAVGCWVTVKEDSNSDHGMRAPMVRRWTDQGSPHEAWSPPPSEPEICLENLAISPDSWDSKEDNLPHLPNSSQDCIDLLTIEQLISKQSLSLSLSCHGKWPGIVLWVLIPPVTSQS